MRYRRDVEVDPQDWTRIARWLDSQGLRLDLDVVPRQFATGLANLNYLVSLGGRPVVFRRPPDGPTGEGSNDMAREWRVLRALAPRFPLVPTPVAFCDDPAVVGVPFQVIEYRDGQPVGGTVAPEIRARFGSTAGPRLTGALIGTMASLHALDPAAVGLGELGRPDGFLVRQVEGWARRSAAAFGSSEPAAVRPVLDFLRASVPEASRVALLHCDLKFDNVLFDPASLQPVAVVDWDMATRGDPLFDLAVLLSYWIEEDDPPALHGLGQVPSLEPGFPRRAEVAQLYADASGSPVGDLSFHLALARFRLAVAWQQMFVKFERGALSDPRYGSFHALARAMVEWTADTVAAGAVWKDGPP